MMGQERDAQAGLPCSGELSARALSSFRDLPVEAVQVALGVDESGCEADVLVRGTDAPSLQLDCRADPVDTGRDLVVRAIPEHPVRDDGAARHDDTGGQEEPPEPPPRSSSSVDAELEQLRLTHLPSMSGRPTEPVRRRQLTEEPVRGGRGP